MRWTYRSSILLIFISSALLFGCQEKDFVEKEPSFAVLLDGKWEAISVTLDGGLMPEWNDFELEINHLSDSSGDFIATGIPHYDSVNYVYEPDKSASAMDFPDINRIWLESSQWKFGKDYTYLIRDGEIDISFYLEQEKLSLTFDGLIWPFMVCPENELCSLLQDLGFWKFQLQRVSE